jgi:hypothetical protein
MSKNNPKPSTWYDAYRKVRYKTPPVQQKPQVIDDKAKRDKQDQAEVRRKKHDWKRGDFDD